MAVRGILWRPNPHLVEAKDAEAKSQSQHVECLARPTNANEHHHSYINNSNLLRKMSSTSSTEKTTSSFCTLGGMMTANFNSINMPPIVTSNPTDRASVAAAAETIDTSDNTTHDHHAADDGNSTNNNHNQSSSTNNEDHSAMHHDSHNNMSMMSQGTVMYMDGFQSALFHNSQTPPPCLNFLHPTVSVCSDVFGSLNGNCAKH